ncbi:beta-1,3-galactosyltransferase pvg3 [Brachypodium distachyon]|uniref:Hexosyltransferase n=1 Tax=Brachypodium distachyon TaxID=15368 RepID=I1HGQ9_BRADI|nr:beta-1,3-galactosyltransferase pvg3 [Brachypodium distachyon]KQK05014.1 hypothetical protein BRADI_2g17360v3 [Brachypodium distachyon]|eukprot:XP_003567945.1 beta-1,3-galactosyltransferase pvg3 [Brachypodium distachyon]
MSPSLYKQLGLGGGGAGSPVSPTHLLLLVLGAAFLALTVFVIHPNDFRLQSFFSPAATNCAHQPAATATATFLPTKPSSSPPASTDAATSPPPVRVLIGIQTTPSKYERRNLLRTVYSLQIREHPHLAAAIDIRFVLCNVTSATDSTLVSLESLLNRDVLLLDCAENMDGGKTYDFFSAVARNPPSTPPPDYVMKADDDTYLRLPALLAWLSAASRADAYLGLQMPCDTENFYPFPPFMSGMGYALSWDLVSWVAESEVSRRDRVGPEDMWTGRWLNVAGKAKNRYDGAPRMYNYRGASPASCFRRDFRPDTIAVHMLKDNGRWAETLAYFNASAVIEPEYSGRRDRRLP